MVLVAWIWRENMALSAWCADQATFPTGGQNDSACSGCSSRSLDLAATQCCCLRRRIQATPPSRKCVAVQKTGEAEGQSIHGLRSMGQCPLAARGMKPEIRKRRCGTCSQSANPTTLSKESRSGTSQTTLSIAMACLFTRALVMCANDLRMGSLKRCRHWSRRRVLR